MKPVITVAIAGLGARGDGVYGSYIIKHPEKFKVVAAADIDSSKVQRAKERYRLSEESCFPSAEDMLQKPKLADVMLICTQDKQHYDHAIPALQKGYHLLLEKPISPDENQCIEIVKTANQYERSILVGHVLRYTVFYRTIKDLIDSGKIGRLMNIQAIENIGYWHQAHSFVRGNWRRKEETSPIILAKCCHDMDIILWLSGKHCKSVSSYGNLSHFRPESAPAGATKYCLSGCKAKDSCPYDAEKIYLNRSKYPEVNSYINLNADFLVNGNATDETIREALKRSPYGRCVYHCDNDVMDHQIVNLELEDDVIVNFTMSAFSAKCSRHIRVMGTLGEIEADMDDAIIRCWRFGEDQPTIIDVHTLTDDLSVHGGGDARLMDDLYELLSGGTPSSSLNTIEDSVESHLVAMRAEESRITGKQISLNE